MKNSKRSEKAAQVCTCSAIQKCPLHRVPKMQEADSKEKHTSLIAVANKKTAKK